jgi:hypothetical protein
MAFPFVVNGLREGICMLGMTSWGKLPDSLTVVSSSSSRPEAAAWLAPSSDPVSSSESLNDCNEAELGVLGSAEGGMDERESTLRGDRGFDREWVDMALLLVRGGEDLQLSGSLPAAREESREARRTLRLPCVVCARALSPLLSPDWDPLPKAASSVSARLCTPKLLSFCLLAAAAFLEACMDCSISSSVLMKKVVGAWLGGPLPMTEGSTRLDFRDRGLLEGGASPPGSGRMLAGLWAQAEKPAGVERLEMCWDSESGNEPRRPEYSVRRTPAQTPLGPCSYEQTKRAPGFGVDCGEQGHLGNVAARIVVNVMLCCSGGSRNVTFACFDTAALRHACRSSHHLSYRARRIASHQQLNHLTPRARHLHLHLHHGSFHKSSIAVRVMNTIIHGHQSAILHHPQALVYLIPDTLRHPPLSETRPLTRYLPSHKPYPSK